MKEKYNKYKEKFELPNFEELNHEFEISSLEEDEFLLRNIRRKLVDKIEFVCKMFDNIIQTETNIVSMREASDFSDLEKNKVLALYQKLMFFDRLAMELMIDEGDKKTAEFISEFYKFWNSSKEELLSYFTKIKNCWNEDNYKKEPAGYFG